MLQDTCMQEEGKVHHVQKRYKTGWPTFAQSPAHFHASSEHERSIARADSGISSVEAFHGRGSERKKH